MNGTVRLNRCLLLCMLLSLATNASAGGITARAGTLGYGAELSVGLSGSTQLRIGANGGSIDTSGNEGGVEYDLTFKMSSANLLLNWHPFNGVFYTSLGALYNDNKFEARSKAGTTTVGSNTYANPNLYGEITFKKFSPYFGIGFGSSPNSKGIGWSLDVGVVYQGSPEVTLTSTSGVSQADLDQEAADLEESIEDYKLYPHIGFSFGVRF